MAMFRPNTLGLCLLVAFSGCAAPPTQSWDDPLYEKIIQDYSETDLDAGKRTSSMQNTPKLGIRSKSHLCFAALGGADVIRGCPKPRMVSQRNSNRILKCQRLHL